MRSPLWFVVAGLIAVAGFAGAAFYLMPRLAAADARVMRVVVPGNAVLVFDKPGPYTIYHEKKSTVDGRYYASENVDGLEPRAHVPRRRCCQVKLVEPKTSTQLHDRQSQRHLDLRLHASSSPAATGWRRTWPAAAAMPGRCWPIEQGLFGAMLGMIFGAIAIAFAGLGVAGAIVVRGRCGSARKPPSRS